MSDTPAPSFRQYDRTVRIGPDAGFRPGTTLKVTPVNFLLNNAGMGDFICYSAALKWIADTRPWISGRIYAPEFMVPFFRLVLKEHEHWRIGSGKTVQLDLSECIIGPDIDLNGTRYFQQLLNATGANLIDLGFAYYADMCPAPADVTYPQISFDAQTLPTSLRRKEGQYVVFTPGAPTTSRTLRGRDLNPIITHVRNLGLTPVFLGRGKVTDTHSAAFPEDVNYSDGLDLRDRTTVLEAACIMQHSLCTLGLDNGLLHLAACTPGNLIFGYNIASPEHRRPRRGAHDSRTINITLSEQELSCIHCQSRMKMHVNHSFHQCHYGDLHCRDLLFANQSERWCLAISAFRDRRENGE